MPINFSPLMLISAFLMGSVSAYVAYKRGKNPYLWFALGILFGIFGIFAIFFAPGPRKRAKEPVAAKEPVFVIDGPTDKFWYYLNPSHERQGPMSKEALTAAWKSGTIQPSTFVWHEDLTDWKPLKETLKLETL